ncbi:UDP-N-acetylmuramate dehydrogenase [Pedobacter sp. HMF7647]|uniref:UDP-N-acetylenolpyruvoylglucosamine reductase n=1 Tax=Hufsiella arboris TaxID=2695275 RepID=A0A7K1YEE2_9SPHI|nr:UDP-N-acetylmuramate dehydrogenase [Hufsiella arboris]MXV52966.1 UDP-N-acetylmuramate dehydrogenase [Hufsiella arboris]
MLEVKENVSLKKYNTFGVDVMARYFVEINSEADLAELFADKTWHDVPRLVLGGGSNILFTRDFDGLAIKINIKGIETRVEDDRILVISKAGEVWNDLVQYCVKKDIAGLENLSLIPGSVGASPIQNIGAYGVELKDVFFSCRAFEIATGLIRQFSNHDCHFGYRDSVFKNALKGKFIITEVTYSLSNQQNLKLEYGAIRQELENRKITEPSVKDISDVVSHIRVSKLPDPSTIGNAGSFFKNPIIKVDKFRQLQSAFPDIVHFSVNNEEEKIAAGWMIEKLGWKGKQIGNAGTWKNQALVLVNYGNATGSAIYDVSSKIISDVRSHFGIELEREVNVI